jgi:hypothetical protein
MHGRGEKMYKVLVGKPEGKRPLGRPRRRWEDGIRMELAEMDLIRLAQDKDWRRAVVSAVMNLHVLAPRKRNFDPDTWDRTCVTPAARTGGTCVLSGRQNYKVTAEQYY